MKSSDIVMMYDFAGVILFLLVLQLVLHQHLVLQ